MGDLSTMFGDESGLQVFPYNRDFVSWEENGVIQEELMRNLLMAGGIIFVVVFMLIPAPRIALLVVLNVVMSIVEVVGFAHWWGVTFNGVSTIYFQRF